MAIPAAAPFSKCIHDTILTPLISRLDFMLMDKHFDPSEPDHGTNNELFELIEASMGDLQEQFGKIGKKELHLVEFFDPVEEYIDSIFKPIAAGRLQADKIRQRLETLRNQLAGIRDAIVEPYRTEEEESAGGEDDDPVPVPSKATEQVRAILGGEEMAHLRRAVSGMDKTLKRCLLSLAAFPEGAVIKKRLLIHWWIGDQLVKDAKEGKERFKGLFDMKFVRAIGQEHCSERVHQCTVHPWIHRMIAAVSNSSAFMAVDPDGIPSNDFQRTPRACLRNDGKATLPAGSGIHFHPEVCTIYNIDQKYVKLSADWFAKKAGLRTLQLGQWRLFDEGKKASDAKKFHVELIHGQHLKGVGACRNLRYLSLRGISQIHTIPDSVGNLSELIVLDLRACYNLQELTKGITKLRKLQYLDVSECYLLVEMPKGLGNISDLHVLKGFVVASSARKHSCRISELVQLKSLRKLSICIGKKVMMGRLDELKKLSQCKLDSLRITWAVMASEDSDTKIPDDMKFSLPPTLVKLDLQCFPSKEFGHLLSTNWLSDLEKLERLYLTGGALNSLEPLRGSRVGVRPRLLRHLKDGELEKISHKIQ